MDPESGGAHKGRIGIKAGLKDWAFFDCFFAFFSVDRSSWGIGLAEWSVVTLHYAGQLWTWPGPGGEPRGVTHGARGAGGARAAGNNVMFMLAI